MKNDTTRSTAYSAMYSSSSLPYLNRRGYEKKLISFMALGNPMLLSDYLDNHIAKAFANVIGHLSAVPLTQAKYQGINLATLACRAAVEAGVPGKDAAAVCDGCTAKYDAMADPTEQWPLAKETMLQFCEMIHEVKFSHYSGAVRQCCEYIDLNIHSSISLDELSQVCHLSSHYVSDIFRKELGIGALQYVHQVKMQYAKFLLENSDQGIAEISSLLSYPSHSNFSQRFKKIYGITPHEFRTSCGR